jgi:Helix-turn-helix of DDE superfamily endonuclease
LTCFYQALLVLVWFRKAEDKTLLGAGFGVSRATAHRYVADGVAVLAAQAPDLHDALRRAAADGGSPAILDGKLFDCDRLTVPLRVGARLVLLLSPYAVVNLLAVGVGALLLLVGFSVARRPRAHLEVTSENAP